MSKHYSFDGTYFLYTSNKAFFSVQDLECNHSYFFKRQSQQPKSKEKANEDEVKFHAKFAVRDWPPQPMLPPTTHLQRMYATPHPPPTCWSSCLTTSL